MKLFAIILIGTLVACQAEEITQFVESTDDLFETAWDYQNRLTSLQNDITQKLLEVRGEVSGVLKGSTNETLTQVHENAIEFGVKDSEVRVALHRLLPNGCISDLIGILDGLTHVSGYESSNCLKHYDTSVQGRLDRGNEILKEYDNFANLVQQTVVEAFIGRNVFKDPNSIIESIISNFKKLNDQWEITRPNVDEFVKDLKTEIAGFNNQLGQCFNSLQIEYSDSYEKVSSKRAVCEEFARSARAFV